MDGKAIESSTGWDASTKKLRSKDPRRDERGRLRDIKGRSLFMTEAAVTSRAFSRFSRAAVAGKQDLEAIVWHIDLQRPKNVEVENEMIVICSGLFVYDDLESRCLSWCVIYLQDLQFYHQTFLRKFRNPLIIRADEELKPAESEVAETYR